MFSSIFKRLLRKKYKKVGLALGGGAARGIAHIGVLKALEENNIHIDCISGVSSGSIVGGIYASGVSISEIIKIINDMTWPDIGQITVSTKGLFSSQKIEDFIKKYAKQDDISKMKIPFATSAINLLTGEEVVFKTGQLSKAVRASASFPGIYIPFEYNGNIYVDGSISNILPVKALKKIGADFIIGVDVIPQNVKLNKIPDNSFYIIDRCLDLIFEKIPNESKYKGIDVLIQPNINNYITSIDLYNKKQLILSGKEEAKKKISLIKNKLGI